MLRHVCHRSAALASLLRRHFSAPPHLPTAAASTPAAATAATSVDVSDTDEPLLASIPGRAPKRSDAQAAPSEGDPPSSSSGAAPLAAAPAEGLYTLAQYHRDRRLIADQIRCGGWGCTRGGHAQARTRSPAAPCPCPVSPPLTLPTTHTHTPLQHTHPPPPPLHSAAACGSWTRALWPWRMARMPPSRPARA